MLASRKRVAFASLSTLFKPKASTQSASLRPPYAHDKALLSTLCATCVEKPCVASCEENIIVLDNENFPSLVFTQSGCTFCKECALACPLGVLTLEEEPSIEALFSIDTKQCMAWNHVICNSCADVCDAKAITFFGMLRPLLDKEKCTGCGFCYGICPSNAVKYRITSQGV